MKLVTAVQGLERRYFAGRVVARFWQGGREQWRWLVRRWRFAVAGFAAALLGSAGWQFDALSALWEHEREVQNMQVQWAALKAQAQAQAQAQTQTQAQAPTHVDALHGPPAWLSQWPDSERQALIWLHFSRLLAQHGVHLQALRPVPDVVSAPLASQAVAVRLHAKFDDWVAVWRSLNAQGPVWSVDRLRITPQGEGLNIEAVLRVWFGGDRAQSALSEHAQGLPSLSPVVRVQSAVFWQEPRVRAQVPIEQSDFGSGEASIGRSGATGQTSAVEILAPDPLTAVDAVDALAGSESLSADPAQWPLERIRLLGVWRHAQEARAILSAGPHWVQARVGQRVGSMGHRLDSIHAHEVHLRGVQGQVKVLGLKEVPP